MKHLSKSFLIIILSSFMTNCYGQAKPLGEEALNLENFDFKLPIETLLPEKNKSKDYKNAFEIRFNADDDVMITRDSTFVNNYSPDKKLVGFEYKQVNWSDRMTVATFKGETFQKITIATDLNDHIKIVGAVKDEMSTIEAQNFIRLLKKYLGDFKTMKASWNNKLTIYEWVKKDRIIRYVSTFNDESNTMKIVIDQDRKTITNGKKEPHFVGYFFQINPKYKKEIIGQMNSGDLVFLNAESE